MLGDHPVEFFKIKMIEPIRLLSREERQKILDDAYWNIFKIRSSYVFIDLLTDSGTNAMSQEQWSWLMRGDESYAGSESWHRFEETIKEILGFPYVLPAHQGRAAERILYSHLLTRTSPKNIVPSNTHFDTGRTVIEYNGGIPLDLPDERALDSKNPYPFKGNINVKKLKEVMDEGKVSFVVLVLTNNTRGGQPVSLENIREASNLCKKYGVDLVLDISRFAENAYFIKEKEKEYSHLTVKEIVKKMMMYADHVIMSAKKDGISNIGGFIATKYEEVYQALMPRLVMEEGFVTYGGLAGRDLEAIAQGLKEAVDENYLRYRISQVRFLGELLENMGVPIIKPTGGHAVYIDVKEYLPNVPQENFPADTLAAYLYLESGIRSVGLGSLAFMRRKNGETFYPDFEYLRLAIPRRVYTESHMRYVASSFEKINKIKNEIKGLKLVWEPEIQGVRHFLAKLKPL